MTSYEVATHEEIRDQGYERTPRGWRPLGNVVGGLTKAQWRRWSYVSLQGTLAIPGGSMKAFDVAVRLGKIARPDTDSTFDRIRNAGEAAYVEVRPSHRDKLIELLECGPRTWERDVTAWAAARMAHRCASKSRGIVVLFFRPEDVCPACGANLNRHEVSQ